MKYLPLIAMLLSSSALATTVEDRERASYLDLKVKCNVQFMDFQSRIEKLNIEQTNYYNETVADLHELYDLHNEENKWKIYGYDSKDDFATQTIKTNLTDLHIAYDRKKNEEIVNPTFYDMPTFPDVCTVIYMFD